jgi:tetratricopeptide (TPR) repeat protein
MNKSSIKKLFLLVILTISIFLIGCADDTIKKGNICLNLGDYLMAESFYEKALLDNPLSFEARLGMGKALLQHIIDNKSDTALWKKTLLNLEAARNLHPAEDLSTLVSEAWNERAQMMLSIEDTIGALNALSRSIEINNRNVAAINSTGILYFRRGDIEKSEILFRKAVAIDSMHAPAFFNLGMIVWSKHDYLEARNYWLTASKLAPEDDDMVYWLALAEKKLQEPVK